MTSPATAASFRYRHRHLLGIEGLSPDEITLILDLAGSYVEQNRAAEKKSALLRGRTIINLFFENSTRTRTSFELAAKRLGADAVEFHTGDYANQAGSAGKRLELKRLQAAAAHAGHLGLHVYAGHGLDYENVGPVAKIKNMEELNIGYSIVARAVWVGFETAVREMLRKIR